jgi:hypothetical protein
VLRAHYNGFRALLAPLEARAGAEKVEVYDGSADALGETPSLPADRPERYVVTRPDSMPMSSERLAQHSNELTGRLYVTHVGVSVRQVQWLQEQTRALLLDKRPVVTGRRVAPLSLLDSSPVSVDRDLQPAPLYAVDVYTLFTA